MKVEIEIPDKLGELLKSVGKLVKVDPDFYLKDYVQYYAIDSVRASLDTLGDNALFLVEDLEKAYGLRIRVGSK